MTLEQSSDTASNHHWGPVSTLYGMACSNWWWIEIQIFSYYCCFVRKYFPKTFKECYRVETFGRRKIRVYFFYLDQTVLAMDQISNVYVNSLVSSSDKRSLTVLFLEKSGLKKLPELPERNEQIFLSVFWGCFSTTPKSMWNSLFHFISFHNRLPCISYLEFN